MEVSPATAPALRFVVDPDLCTRCGSCVADCPLRLIERHGDDAPHLPAANEGRCILCQHCLALCPQAAISIGGFSPEDSQPVTRRTLPSLDEMDLLVRARRSVRQYRNTNAEPALVGRLLDATAHAPTGVNSRQLTFSWVQDRAVLDRLRARLMQSLVEASAADQLTASEARVTSVVLTAWQEGRDVVFRNAPHVLFVSSPPEAPCAKEDVVIALAYFELLAQSAGLGTVWCGYVYRLLEMLPACKPMFQIPEGHVYYPMLFGIPAVHYARTVQRRGSARVRSIS